VVCENEAIAKTFKITGLDGVFTIAPSVDAALSDAADDAAATG
jgi:anti-anti-sigma regulatory factor